MRLACVDRVDQTRPQVVIAYISYLAASAMYLSGICSVLFCGMVGRPCRRTGLHGLGCAMSTRGTQQHTGSEQTRSPMPLIPR